MIGGGGGGGRGGAEVGQRNAYSSFWYTGSNPSLFWREGELVYINRVLSGPHGYEFLNPDMPLKPEFYRPATNGGRGGFSFTDTTIYGARQQANFLENAPPEYIIGPPNIWLSSGYVESYTMNYLAQQVIPGGGGGVRILRKLKYGSDAPSYSQNGAVILRLIKRD